MKLGSKRHCPNVRFPFLRTRTDGQCPVPIIPVPAEDRLIPVLPVERRAKAGFLRALDGIKEKLNLKNPAEESQATSSQIVKSSVENIASKLKIPVANLPSKLLIPVEKRSPKYSNPTAQSPNVPENPNKFQVRAQLPHIRRLPFNLIKTANFPEPLSGRTRRVSFGRV